MKDYELIKTLLERSATLWKDMGYGGWLYCKGELVMAAKLGFITCEQYSELEKMIEKTHL